MNAMRFLTVFACALPGVAATTQAAEPLRFDTLAGWWSANPHFGGESSPIALHFSEKEGKPVAQLALPGIGMYGIDLGAVTLAGNSLDTRPLSFPLTWDAEHQTLRGLLPKDAAPVYDIPVEFHRSEALVAPAPPQWQGARPQPKWSVDIGGPAWAGIERDAQSGLLFVGNEPGAMYAIDLGGVVRWKFDTGQPIRGRPAAIGDSLYVTSDSGYLYRLDKISGKERWRARIDTGSPPRIPTNQEKSRWDRYGSSVIADGHTLYVASRDSHLYAIDMDQGRQIWRVAAGDMMTATPALYRDTVVFAAFDGKVQAVSARDGKARWIYDAKLAVAGDLVIDRDRVLLGSRTYDLVALDAATGAEQWKHYYWFSWIESPPVVHDDVVYTGSSDATGVYALNSKDGSLRWKTAVPGWAWARTAVNDDFVIAGTVGSGAYPGFRSGALVALERRSGAMRWLYLDPPAKEVVEAGKGWGFGAAPLIADGVVYAVDLNGRVYAFAL
ncbi:MAG TPA: PQQ-binding-like beta-propeller repeat protein [Povalibacter sp.]|nr:PQQ-binding-like beta-propeller repeat protein [Povalibacter sp.]